MNSIIDRLSLKKIIFTTAMFYALSTKLFAGSYVLVVGGWVDHPRHYNIGKRIENITKEAGEVCYFSMGENKYYCTDEKKVFSMHSAEDLEKTIKKLTSQMKEGDTLTILVTGHGCETDRLDLPLSGNIPVPKKTNNKKDKDDKPTGFVEVNTISNYDLIEMLKAKAKGVRFYLIGTQCYSGGLHHTSINSENVCSAASIDYRSPSSAYEDGPNVYNIYGKAFWDEWQTQQFDFDKNSQTSFYEAHISGLYYDILNGYRAQLSSDAYLDYTLRTGAYDWFGHLLFSGNINEREYEAIRKGCVPDIRPGPWDRRPNICKYIPFSYLIQNGVFSKQSMARLGIKKDLCLIDDPFERHTQMQNIREVYHHAMRNFSSTSPNSSPFTIFHNNYDLKNLNEDIEKLKELINELKLPMTMYHQALKTFLEKDQYFIETLKKNKKKIEEMEQRHEEELKKLDKETLNQEYLKRSKAISILKQKQHDEKHAFLKETKLLPLYMMLPIIRRAPKALAFMQNPLTSEKEKKKFKSLLYCEAGSFLVRTTFL